MFCSPRYNWGVCGDLSVYYYVVFSIYASLFITYLVTLAVSMYKRPGRRNLKFKMRISILLYSFFGALHTLSNFSSVSMFSALFTEICLSMTFLFIMLAILHLIEHWIYLFIIINGKINPSTHQTIFKDGFSLQLILGMTISAGASAVVIDVLMIYLPGYEMLFHTLHLGVWGTNTVLLGVFTAICGSRVTRYFEKAKSETNTYATAYKKFRFLHYTYTIAGIGYGCLYVVAIIVTVWYYTLISWYIMYSLFHFAIIITGFGMILIFKKRVLSNKVSTDTRGLGTPVVTN